MKVTGIYTVLYYICSVVKKPEWLNEWLLLNIHTYSIKSYLFLFWDIPLTLSLCEKMLNVKR